MKSTVYQQHWDPPTGAVARRHAIYLLHGLSEHTGRYDHLARWLAGFGWRVAAHDHPGHGRSDGDRGRIRAATSALPSDLAETSIDAIDKFSRKTGSPVILVGHSLGGTLAAELVLEHRVPVAALVLSSPGLAPLMTSSQRWQLGLLYRLAPDLTLPRPVAGERLSHDPDVVAAYRNDPLVHGTVSARLIRWLIDSGARSLASAHQLDVPTLMLVGGADRIVDASASRKFAERAPAGLLKMHWYDNYFHEVFNEDPTRREQVLSDLKDWLLQREASADKQPAGTIFSS